MVEFALIPPIFAMLVFGTFSGAEAYNQKLTLNAAAREATRYGATLPVTPSDSNCTTGSSDIEKWANCVEQAAVQTATGQLKVGVAGRSICVAYVNNSGSGISTTSYTYTTSDTGTPGTSACSGNAKGTEPQVQVVVKNDAQLQAILFTQTLHISADSVSRYERATS